MYSWTHAVWHKIHTVQYLPRVPQCLSVPSSELGPPIPSPPSESTSTWNRGGGRNTLACGWGSPNSDDWRDSLVLCLQYSVPWTWLDTNILVIFRSLRRESSWPGLWREEAHTGTINDDLFWYNIHVLDVVLKEVIRPMNGKDHEVEEIIFF